MTCLRPFWTFLQLFYVNKMKLTFYQVFQLLTSFTFTYHWSLCYFIPWIKAYVNLLCQSGTQWEKISVKILKCGRLMKCHVSFTLLCCWSKTTERRRVEVKTSCLYSKREGEHSDVAWILHNYLSWVPQKPYYISWILFGSYNDRYWYDTRDHRVWIFILYFSMKPMNLLTASFSDIFL